MSSRNTTEVANSVQNNPSEMASLGMSWMSSTAVATMLLTMAAPVGMPVFGFSWANTRGMFWFFATYWATAFVFIAASELVVWCLPVDQFRQWLFYTLRQAFLLWCIGYAVFRYATSRSEVEKARMRRQEPVLIAAAVLCLCIIIEDVAMILVFDSSVFASAALLPLYISERNFSENILLLAFSFFTLRAASDTLRLRFKEPPAVDAPDTQAYVDELLPAFCERYNLTARERVIVEQVLQGKDNQNIASSLQLALGTVKAHVHNILKKTGVSTRQELTQLFWKG